MFFAMTLQKFYLLGDEVSSARAIEVDSHTKFDDLKQLIAAHFAIVEPKGVYQHSFMVIPA